MFNEKDYKAAFSKVKASEDIHMEVLNMANRRQNRKNAGIRRTVVLAAAVIALMAMTVTAFAAEEIAGWFQSYFSRNGEAVLSQQQEAYLTENEQLISQSKTIDGWTVELRSAIHDDTTGYIILGITAPVETDWDAKYDKNGDGAIDYIFGNSSNTAAVFNEPVTDLLSAPDGVELGCWGWGWAEDGDGLANTRNLVVNMHPAMDRSTLPPFGSEAEYSICIENIVWEYVDEEYKDELMNGKYAGHGAVRFTAEENERLYGEEILAEGTWDFTVTFAQYGEDEMRKIEILDAPITTNAWFYRPVGDDWGYVQERVMLTSVVMQNLTVTFYCEGGEGTPELTNYEDDILNPYVVLKDGTQIELWSYGSSGTDYVTLVAEQPIVFEEVDHILLADGTIIPMPELETN